MAALTPHIRRASPLQDPQQQTQARATHTFSKRALGGGWVFLILFILFLVLVGAGSLAWKRYRKSRSHASANYPAPAPTGIKDWFGDKISALKRGRNRQGDAGYEPSSRGGGRGGGGNQGFLGGFGGFGGNSTVHRARGSAFDPDEAWDARVGNEAMFEEQELGLHAPATYTGAGYGGGYAGIGGAPPPGYDEDEARAARSQELDSRYEEEMHGGGSGASAGAGGKGRGAGQSRDPFGDEHAVGSSLRGVSPRPIDTSSANRGAGGHAQEVDSPTERKSAFREDV